MELTDGAFGAPFTCAAVVSISPANAGVATIAGRTDANGKQLYDLSFKPDNAFIVEAVASYTLGNAFTTSTPGTVTITVEARPDPTLDPEVTGLLSLSGGSSILGGGMANDRSELRRLQEAFGVVGALTGGGFGAALAEGPRHPTFGVADDSQGVFGVWVSGAATFGRADDTLDREGFKFSTDGLTIGVDRRLGETLVLGGAVGWATDESRIGDNGTRSEAYAWSVSLYGSWQPAEKAYVDVVLGYGRLDFDSRRYVTANGDFAVGQREGDQWFGALTAGWDFRNPKGVRLVPYGRMEATRSVLGAFTAQGRGLYALAYEQQTMDTLTGAFGRSRGDRRLHQGRPRGSRGAGRRDGVWTSDTEEIAEWVVPGGTRSAIGVTAGRLLIRGRTGRMPRVEPPRSGGLGQKLSRKPPLML